MELELELELLLRLLPLSLRLLPPPLARLPALLVTALPPGQSIAPQQRGNRVIYKSFSTQSV